MVIDKLENLEKYVSLNPLFAEAVAFLKATDLQAHEVGKVVLKEGELMVNLADARPKTKEEARLETHNDFIDPHPISPQSRHLLPVSTRRRSSCGTV